MSTFPNPDGPEARLAEMRERDFANDLEEETVEIGFADMRIAELEATLKDLILGADMMLQPSLKWPDSVKHYIEEVKRVAKAGLYERH